MICKTLGLNEVNLSLPLLRTVSEMKISHKWCRFCHQMANCHEYSKQGEGENARETKNGRNVERRRWCLRCGEIMYPAVVVMLSETFFVRAEQVLIHNIFSLFKSMWLLGQICKSQVDVYYACILALKLNKFHFFVLRVQYLRLKFRCC